MKFRFSLKRAIIDILYIKEQVYPVFKDDERYKILLDFFMEKDYLSDDDYHPLPSYEEISIKTGIKTYDIRKKIKSLYDEIFDFDSGVKLRFRKTEIYFWLEYFKNYTAFKCDELACVPRVGDNIEIPFLKAKINTDYFYVESIRHSFEGDRQIIHVNCKPGTFNAYWHLRKHEAIEKRELGFHDFYDLNEYEIKDKLGLGR